MLHKPLSQYRKTSDQVLILRKSDIFRGSTLKYCDKVTNFDYAHYRITGIFPPVKKNKVKNKIKQDTFNGPTYDLTSLHLLSVV